MANLHVDLSFRVDVPTRRVSSSAALSFATGAQAAATCASPDGILHLDVPVGTRVLRCSVNGAPAPYHHASPLTSTLALVSRAHGLEDVAAALHAVSQSPPDLTVSLPPALLLSAAPIRVVVDYTLPCYFSLHDGLPFCTALPTRAPPLGGRRATGGAIFPALADPAARYTGAVTVAIEGAPCVLTVECSGSSSGVQEAVTGAWRFAADVPLCASAFGWVLGPLQRYHREPTVSQHLQHGVQSLGGGNRGGGNDTLNGGNASGAGVPGMVGTTTTSFSCTAAKCVPSVIGVHAARSRRAINWMADYLDTPFPSGRLAHVFLPPHVLPSAAVLTATPTGLAPPSPHGASLPFPDAPLLDCIHLGGLSLYPDELLTDGATIDAAAACARAQVAAAAHAWFGSTTSPAAWQDEWLRHGLGGFLAAQFLRTQRGDTEHRLDCVRAAEVAARLEEQYPRLGALCPPSAAGAATAPATNHSREGGGAGEEDPLAVAWHPMRAHYLAAKAPVVLHMLAARLGEAAVQRVVRLVAQRGVSASILAGPSILAGLGVPASDGMAAAAAASSSSTSSGSAASVLAALATPALSTDGFRCLLAAASTASPAPSSRPQSLDDFFA